MKRVVIVGGGVVGLCAAYYAVRKGWDVVVLEREGEDYASCATGSAGMITPSHFVPLAAPGMVRTGLRMMCNPRSPFYVRPRLSLELIGWGWRFWKASNPVHVERSSPLLRDLALASRSEFEQLADGSGGRIDLVKRGLLMLCKTERGLHEEALTAQRANELGIPARVLDCNQLRELEPNLQMDVRGGVLFPLDCHLSPDRFVQELRERVLSLGAKIRYHAPVTGFRKNGSRLEGALTSAGEFAADDFVLAAGCWTPALARELPLNLPMQPGKGYSLTLEKPRRLPALCAILTEARVAVTPMGTRLRFGGTMELAGMDCSVNPHRVQGILDSVPRYLPEFGPEDFRDTPVWFGFRPCSPDGLPYLGRSSGVPNLIVAAGHAMLGLTLGPITGRIVSELLEGQQPSIRIDALSPERYA